MPSVDVARLLRKPSPATGWAVVGAVSVIWAALRVLVFTTLIFPLTYALPLLLCVWTCDRVMLWTMTVVFACLATLKQFFLLPPEALPTWADWAVYLATLFNILVGAVAVHAIIFLRERTERALAEVDTQATELAQQAEEASQQNEDLTQQAEELTQQNEELAQQAEELSGQSEELSAQNEELEAQAEEIRDLNTELRQREALLQALLDAARVPGTERAAVEHVCRASLEMFGPVVTTVVVYELQGDEFVIRGSAGLDEATPSDPQPAADRFGMLVVQEQRTACLNDTSLRPDLAVLQVPGQPPFLSVLCAPLMAGGRAFGAVSIYSRQKYEWTAAQFRIAEWLAAQTSQILETLRLQEQTRRQAALIDLTPDAIIVRKFDGTIILWGHGAEVLYGWTKEEAIGATTHALLRTRFPRPLKEVDAILEQTGRWMGELVHTTRAGREVVVESRWLASRDARGEIVELLESNVDVTARVRATESLQQADQRKNEFLATLSHELRNPLAPIRYALELLEENAIAGSRPKQVIERQLTHLVRLVDDLLDVSRIASNKIRLRTERVALQEVVEQAVETLEPDIEGGTNAVFVSMPPEPIWMEADAVRLSQVLTNLLTNAVRYTPPGGRITVAAVATEDDVLISVADTGIGLSPDDLTRVFEMFAQVGDPGHGGLGIGLSLVKGLVELHGGTVEARSAGLGKGAEFRVRLPRAAAPSSEAVSVEGATVQSGPRRRILVVDDNVDAAEMMKAFLELHGHDVSIAYDGQSALAIARETRPEIGLFDIGLPGMSGYELAARMRQDPTNGHIYLIAVTGWGQEDDRERARASGFDAHLTKPPDPEAIHALIASADRGGRRQAPATSD